MTDIDHVYFDADCLLAESCLAIYETEEQSHPQSNQNTTSPPQRTNQLNTNNTQDKPAINKSDNGTKEETVYGFTKADLDDPEKIKAIMGKAKKEKNLRAVKTVLRSAISLGAVAATTFAAAPLAVVSAASIAANLGVSLNDQKHNREMQQMITLIDSKISKTNGEMFTEKDPEKQKAMREYINALKQAKMKLRSA